MINDFKQNISNISLSAIKVYLSNRNWILDEAYKSDIYIKFYNVEIGDSILLPIDKTYIDYEDRLTKTFRILSAIYETEISVIIDEILNTNSNKIQLRIISEVAKNGKIPLSYGEKCVEALKDIILFAAAAEDKKQSVVKKITKKQQQSLDRFQLAQTSIGSYIFNIETIDEEIVQQETFYNIPTQEQKIMIRVQKSLEQIDAIVTGNNNLQTVVDGNGYLEGATANICDSFLKLNYENALTQIETNFSYSKQLGLKTNDTFLIKSEHFDTMKIISKKYKENSVDKEIFEIIGYIYALESFEDENKVKIKTQIENKNRSIVIHLDYDKYKIACDAHRDERQIYAYGEIDMQDKIWKMSSPSNFKVY